MAHWEELDVSRYEEAISIKLRQADKDELNASLGDMDTKVALSTAINESAFVGLLVGDENEIVGVFGVADAEEIIGLGYPWMVATDGLKKYTRQFLREGREFVAGLKYDFMTNLVDSRNELHLKWLEWVGFEVERDTPLYLDDPTVPFYPFYKVNLSV